MASVNERMSCGVAAFFRNGDRASLVNEWLPALDGVVAKLREGAVVADVGCGHGHSTVLMAQAFPRSRFHGFDTHEGSIATTRRVAAEAGDRGMGDVFRHAGFHHLRRIAETPFTMVRR